MKRYRWTLRAALALAAAVILVVTVAATGTANDPLVSLSYLQETFLGQILGNVDAKLAERDTLLRQEVDNRIAGALGALPGEAGGTAATFTAVTLKAGQILTGETGCEVLLRSGAAMCAADYQPGLVDQTDGTVLAGGKPLAENHLYMIPAAGPAVSAAEAVTLLVRGTYAVD